MGNLQRVLDSWRFWMGVAYFGLAACVVGLFFLYWQGADAREDVVNERVVTCVKEADAIPSTLGLIQAVADSLRGQIYQAEADIANGDVHARTDLVAFRASYGKVLIFRKQYLMSAPSAQDCRDLAKDLGVS